MAPAGEPTPRTHWTRIGVLAGFAYLFFLAIAFIGQGMKASFKAPVQAFLNASAGGFDELSSFVTGIIGTSLIQSSSSVTSMAVVLTQEGVIPLVVAVGIAHGANLGTSVTSTIVAFAASAKRLTGKPLADLKALLFEPRERGFEGAVGTAVVHDMFNIVMVTGILLCLELPFGLVRNAAAASAELLAEVSGTGGAVLGAMKWLSPGTYTKPLAGGLLDLGVPGWALALLGLPLLFWALKGFSGRMRRAVLRDVDDSNLASMGHKLLGRTPGETFVRGLVLTILVQSSSATTSMVVPLAAMGFFRVRQVFPFIMGANIGTCTTALLAAMGGLGETGFLAGLTIALSHLYLNSLAVLLVFALPGLRTSILGAAQVLAAYAARRPAWLLLYVTTLALLVPVAVLLLPLEAGVMLLAAILALVVVGPHVREARRRTAARVAPAPAPRDADGPLGGSTEG